MLIWFFVAKCCMCNNQRMFLGTVYSWRYSSQALNDMLGIEFMQKFCLPSNGNPICGDNVRPSNCGKWPQLPETFWSLWLEGGSPEDISQMGATFHKRSKTSGMYNTLVNKTPRSYKSQTILNTYLKVISLICGIFATNKNKPNKNTNYFGMPGTSAACTNPWHWRKLSSNKND